MQSNKNSRSRFLGNSIRSKTRLREELRVAYASTRYGVHNKDITLVDVDRLTSYLQCDPTTETEKLIGRLKHEGRFIEFFSHKGVEYVVLHNKPRNRTLAPQFGGGRRFGLQ